MKTGSNERPELAKSETVAEIPLACADEQAAVEFFERQRWGDKPTCAHCQSEDVYQMKDRDGSRNKRFLWRCKACGEQYTVRIGTVYEESRLPLTHWAYVFWRACASKKGVSAREIQRERQISYKSALFLMHRVRFALTTDNDPSGTKLTGDVECDETYCGGQARHKHGRAENRGTSTKVPVLSLIQRDGSVRSKVIARVNHRNVANFIRDNTSASSTLHTDESLVYRTMYRPKTQRHFTVNHRRDEYVRAYSDGVTHVNTCESFFSLIKRGLMGIYHAVSKEHLHRYVSEFDFRWNTRKLNDGERVSLAIRGAEGKRLMYLPRTA